MFLVDRYLYLSQKKHQAPKETHERLRVVRSLPRSCTDRALKEQREQFEKSRELELEKHKADLED